MPSARALHRGAVATGQAAEHPQVPQAKAEPGAQDLRHGDQGSSERGDRRRRCETQSEWPLEEGGHGRCLFPGRCVSRAAPGPGVRPAPTLSLGTKKLGPKPSGSLKVQRMGRRERSAQLSCGRQCGALEVQLVIWGQMPGSLQTCEANGWGAIQGPAHHTGAPRQGELVSPLHLSPAPHPPRRVW